MHILILRDPRESKKKCSLTPLRGKERIRFVEYAPERRVVAAERIFLDPEGEEFAAEDRGKDLFLIDCSWRRVPQLLATVEGPLVHRRLPSLVTAYPRKSKQFADPAAGLASIEALFAAAYLLGERRDELLEGYRWRDEFLEANRDFFAAPDLSPRAMSEGCISRGESRALDA